jgi:hypothetical protein
MKRSSVQGCLLMILIGWVLVVFFFKPRVFETLTNWSPQGPTNPPANTMEGIYSAVISLQQRADADEQQIQYLTTQANQANQQVQQGNAQVQAAQAGLSILQPPPQTPS